MWGADGSESSSDPFPGDNGDWSSYDSYLAQVITDLKANNMLQGLVIDIWNEPDGTYFWKRSQSQYLEMWGRAFYIFQYVLSNTLNAVRRSQQAVLTALLEMTYAAQRLQDPPSLAPQAEETPGGPAGFHLLPRTAVFPRSIPGTWRGAVVICSPVRRSYSRF